MSVCGNAVHSPIQDGQMLRRRTVGGNIYDGEPPAKCGERSPPMSRYVAVPQRFKPRTIDEFVQFLDNDANRIADVDIWSLFGEGNYVNFRLKLIITALIDKIDKLQRQHGIPAASVHFEEVHYLDVDELESTVITPSNSSHALHHRRTTDSGIDSSSFMFLESPPMPREYYDIRPTLPDLRPFNLLDTYTLVKHRKGAGGFRLELRKLLVNLTRMLHSDEARGQYTMLKPGVRREAKKKQYSGVLIEHIADCISSLIVNVDGSEPDKVALSILIKDVWIAVLYEDRRNPPRIFPFTDEEMEAISGDGLHYMSSAVIRKKIEPESVKWYEITSYIFECFTKIYHPVYRKWVTLPEHRMEDHS